jgi:CheY-like chemotaxis protein
MGRGQRLLVVDDDAMQLRLMKRMLDPLEYSVETACSGEEAIEIVRLRPPDLVRIDMIMEGGIDGAETLRLMRELAPNMQAVMVSGFAGSDRVDSAIALGAHAFLRKPVAMTELAQAIQDALPRRMVDR